MQTRRTFLGRTLGPLLLAPAARLFGAPPAKAPFRLLYGNDTTNIVECTSPFHAKGAPYQPAMLRASVDEASAADAHLLQAGLTWVPFWKSRVYPADEHFAWWQKTFRGLLHPIGEYLLAGGDIVQDYVAHCRSRGVAPFISVRLNDYHRIESLDVPAGSKLSAFDSLGVDRYRREHPELRLAAGQTENSAKNYDAVFLAREGRVLNWALPAVRERMLNFITELAENYDLAGLELDFLRHFRFFRTEETTREERTAIMTQFVGDVRKLLDRTATSTHRWLCVRIPALLALHDPLGIDVAAMAAAGAEMFNLSSNYYTVQQDHDLPQIRALAPGAAIYLEMTHTTVIGRDPQRVTGDSNFYRRTTPEQYLTTARLAAAQGADGVSLFNFAYYREYGSPEKGPFQEPPFDVLPKLANPAALEREPQHYFLAPAWRSVYGNTTQLPLQVRAGQTVKLHLELVGIAQTSALPGRLRIQGEGALDGTSWKVTCAGTALTVSDDVSEPYPHPYTPMLGTPSQLEAWTVPRELLRGGRNEFTLKLTQGSLAKIIFVDLAFA